MSFILDALRKADAERQLGALPDIHVPSPSAASRPAGASQRRRAPAWIALTALAVAIGALAWRIAPDHDGRDAVVAPSTGPSPADAPAPARAAVAARDAAAPAMSPAPPAPKVAAEVPVPPPLPKSAPKPEREAPPKVAAKPDAKPAPKPDAKTPEPDRTASKAAERQPAPAQTGETAPVQVGQPPVIAFADLPPAVRRELPPLTIHGSMYSDNPANRMLLVDRRLLHEGDEVAPGLVLETLMPKAATLRYKGYRFRLAF